MASPLPSELGQRLIEPGGGMALAFTPRSSLRLVGDVHAPPLDAAVAQRVRNAFAAGEGAGVLHLGAAEAATVLPPAFSYVRDIGARFVSALRCLEAPDASIERGEGPDLDDAELRRLVHAVPPMSGAEYVNDDLLRRLWQETGEALRSALRASKESVETFLQAHNPSWHHVGRVHFHLAENRRDPDHPFAFLATYTPRLTAQGDAQHVPLRHALEAYGDTGNKDRLLSLLVPVQRAATGCTWLKTLVDEGALFHPLRWTPEEAFRLLEDAVSLEEAGVVVRLPAEWKGKRPPRPRIQASVGANRPSQLGLDALLDFRVGMSLEGEALTAGEIEELLAASAGLRLLRGRWVHADPQRLGEMLDHYRQIEARAEHGGIGFAEAARLLAETDARALADGLDETPDWAGVRPGAWLKDVMAGLRDPATLPSFRRGRWLRAELRPYQEVGVRWLRLLTQLRLGACLADDMGLGKTLQVLTLLGMQRRGRRTPKRPSLLVAPASLLHNWAAEAERFVPSLNIVVAHASAIPRKELKDLDPTTLDDVDLVVTSYASLVRLSWMQEMDWRFVVLDEAQAIKNPGTRQTRAVKSLRAHARIALTGTPVENRLGDLWSIFDFLNPGLLGSAKAFRTYVSTLEKQRTYSYAPLRALIEPYILRRLKTDPSVISDLPEKSEVTAFCTLGRKQAALYQEAVNELKDALQTLDGIERRGVVLAYLTRFKQICNHPSQWLGDGAWDAKDSGKWSRLQEIAETLAARQDKMLVFTQYRSLTAPLAAFLGSVYGREGLVLHGGTAVGSRKSLVKRFQEDDGVPFFVLSLKAAGTGLNLTAASHVVHFDRWWNPAVEDQATDRAFRIGQQNCVLVHKFVCRGTVEERIDNMIRDKRALSDALLGGGAGKLLTEMSDEELVRLVKLDLTTARGGE